MYSIIINTKYYSLGLIKQKLKEINSPDKFDITNLRKKMQKIFGVTPCFKLSIPWTC